ncbi:hypothetical protein V8J82_11855 [Gymnodinialimonas sp. 2305UL16-5]|uniref:hypothetical protein n=1 Tax=Gymnodinialimonas mytili TaxID=3126503 RepID=UPI003094F299
MARRKSKTADPNEVLARIHPNPARRVVAVGMIAFLGALLLTIAVARPPELFSWMLFLVFFGAGCLWLAYGMWQATGRVIELTRSELREVGGRILCTLDNVARVDRGMFAFKPAGGFLVRLKEAPGRVVAPGAWWRLGRTLALGGVTARREGKEVADLMIILLVERGEEI